MNKIRLLRNIMVAVAIAVGSLSAMSDVKFLIVNFNDGTDAAFALADDPVLTTTASELRIFTTEKSIDVAFSDLKNYQFADNVSELSNIKLSEESYQFLSDEILFTGLKKGDIVKAFSLDGKKMAEAKADDEGRASLDLALLPSGVYIISYGNKTFKVNIS